MSRGTILILLTTVLLNTAASLLVKKGASAIIGNPKITSAGGFFHLLGPAFNLYTLGGVICLAFSFLTFIVLLSRLNVSVAQPMLATVYILTAVGAHFFFGEALAAQKIAGIFVIIFGVYLVSGGAK